MPPVVLSEVPVIVRMLLAAEKARGLPTSLPALPTLS